MDQIDSLKTGQKFKKTEVGEIPVDWAVVKINDICDIVGGSTPSTNNKEFWNGNILWAVPTDITKLKNYIISDTAKKITGKGLSSCGLKLLPIGSILLTSRATIGACAINTITMATNQGFASLICKKNVFNWYILYQTILLQKKFQYLGAGSTFKEISKKSIRSIKISLPPLSEQKKIAKILITVDDAIEKSDKIIKKIKELKKSLMQELLTRGIGHKKFKKTEVGEIPVDWKISQLKNHVSIITKGTTPTTYGHDYTNTGVKFLKVENIDDNGKIKFENIKYISDETNKFLKRSQLKDGDVLFSIAGAIGRVAIINNQILPANTNQALAIIRIKDKDLNINFVKYILLSKIIKNQASFMAIQLAQINLNLPQVGNLKFPLPKYLEQKEIAEILTSVDNEMEKAILNKEKLEEIKKRLLQVLLTGRVRVKV